MITLYIRLSVGILAVLLVVGCSGKEIVNETYEQETDHPYYFDSMGTALIAASKNGYYFLSGNYIYYTDKEKMVPVLLENKPNSTCFSNDIEQEIQNCNAFINLGDMLGFLAYHQDKLYTVEQKVTFEEGEGILHKYDFVQLSKDGATRKTLLTIDERPTAILVHRGYLYYATKGFSQQSEASYRLLRIPVDRSFAKPETLYGVNGHNGSIVYLTAYGNRLYFQDGGMNVLKQTAFDIRSKTATRILSDDDKTYPFMQGFTENSMLFAYFYGDIEDPAVWKAYKANLDGTQIEPLPLQPDFYSIFSADNRYIYARPDDVYLNIDPYKDKYKSVTNEMKVYDAEFQLADTIPLAFKALMSSYIVGDESKMFFYYDDGKATHFEYLDKQEIGSGRAAFKPLLSTPKLTTGTVVNSQ